MVVSAGVTNQTLDRGLRALEVIATATEPPTVDGLAERLGIHRSMAYRIVRTLEDHGLVKRDSEGRCVPWTRLTDLARRVQFSLQSLARPELESAAQDLGHTTFLVVAVGSNAVTIDSVEPPATDTFVGYRPGTRHRLDRGAPGIAICAGGPAIADERVEVSKARQRGWARSSGEVVPGLGSVAVWVEGAGDEPLAALACVFLDAERPDLELVARRLRSSADRIARSVLQP